MTFRLSFLWPLFVGFFAAGCSKDSASTCTNGTAPFAYKDTIRAISDETPPLCIAWKTEAGSILLELQRDTSDKDMANIVTGKTKTTLVKTGLNYARGFTLQWNKVQTDMVLTIETNGAGKELPHVAAYRFKGQKQGAELTEKFSLSTTTEEPIPSWAKFTQ